jgi:hypothetical protein
MGDHGHEAAEDEAGWQGEDRWHRQFDLGG